MRAQRMASNKHTNHTNQIYPQTTHIKWGNLQVYMKNIYLDNKTRGNKAQLIKKKTYPNGKK